MVTKNMKKDIKKYEPPSMKVYRFSDQDKVLTESGGIETPPETTAPTEPTEPVNPPSDYAANALNKLFGGTNTTIEK